MCICVFAIWAEHIIICVFGLLIIYKGMCLDKLCFVFTISFFQYPHGLINKHEAQKTDKTKSIETLIPLRPHMSKFTHNHTD